MGGGGVAAAGSGGGGGAPTNDTIEPLGLILRAKMIRILRWEIAFNGRQRQTIHSHDKDDSKVVCKDGCAIDRLVGVGDKPFAIEDASSERRTVTTQCHSFYAQNLPTHGNRIDKNWLCVCDSPVGGRRRQAFGR